MTTVSDVVTQALMDAGIIGEGQTPSAGQTATAIATLNQLLAQWRTSDLVVYALKTLILPATGAVSYTIGPGGNLNVERPVSVEAAAWRDGSMPTSILFPPLYIMASLADWQRIALQGIPGAPPNAILYEPTFPLATLYVWPQPSSGQIELTVKVTMPTYTSVGDDMALPPEYAAPVRFNLAKWLCAAFGVPLRPDIAQLASTTFRVIKRTNTRFRELATPPNLPQGSLQPRFNVYSGEA